MVIGGAMVQGFASLGGEEENKKAEAIKAVFEKHGLTEDAVQPDGAPNGVPEEMPPPFAFSRHQQGKKNVSAFGACSVSGRSWDDPLCLRWPR